MARTLYRNYNPLQLGLTAANATTGVWALLLSQTGMPAGMVTLHKNAAATNTVIHFGIPQGPKGGLPTCEDARVSIIEVFYKVQTANLSSAPTAVLNKITNPGAAGTGIAALAAVTQSLTFAGVDSVGTTSTNGDHIAVITVTTPFTPNDNESLHLQLTMNEAGTTVLDITGMSVTYL